MSENNKSEASSSISGTTIALGMGVLIVGAAAGNMFGARRLMKQSAVAGQRAAVRTEAAATNKAKFSPDTTAAKMAEIRESQKQVEESVRRAKVKLSDMHSDTQTKLSEAKKQIEKIREKEWNQ